MNARIRIALLLCSLLASPLLAQAEEGTPEQKKEKVDTEFIFGFTPGADVGEAGEKEIEQQTTASLGKRDGTYTALEEEIRYETTPIENFRFEIGVPVAFYDIAGVSGLDDRRQGAFDGLVAEFRYKLLDRDHAPFALTVGAEPRWSRTDEVTGEPVDGYGSDFSITADREFVPDRVFAALSLLYGPNASRARATGDWQRESMLGLSTSVTTQLSPGVFFGAEARYLRKHDGLGLDSFAGEALFIGPTTFVRLSRSFALSGAWGVQVGGHAAGVANPLDLTNFTRQQATLRIEYNF